MLLALLSQPGKHFGFLLYFPCMLSALYPNGLLDASSFIVAKEHSLFSAAEVLLNLIEIITC